jgi:hypothetical protein
MTQTSFAQTDLDAIMMEKNNLCIGPMYNYSTWKSYWEGTQKRENANLGSVSTQIGSLMGNYGIKSNLNFLFGINYVATKASAGVLHGMKGVQDASLFLKYMPYEVKGNKSIFSVYTIGGFSFPVGNYTPDYLPLSIGLRARTGIARLLVDYQFKNFFATGSATYAYRGNVTLDRESYYTTQLINSYQVQMPNVMQYNVRLGLRTERYITELLLNNWTCLGGFDITQNNMPFVSNRMNMTSLGFNGKYNLKRIDGLSITGGASKVIAGRNVGQSTNANIGIFYILRFKNNHKK